MTSWQGRCYPSKVSANTCAMVKTWYMGYGHLKIIGIPMISKKKSWGRSGIVPIIYFLVGLHGGERLLIYQWQKKTTDGLESGRHGTWMYLVGSRNSHWSTVSNGHSGYSPYHFLLMTPMTLGRHTWNHLPPRPKLEHLCGAQPTWQRQLWSR